MNFSRRAPRKFEFKLRLLANETQVVYYVRLKSFSAFFPVLKIAFNHELHLYVKK